MSKDWDLFFRLGFSFTEIVDINGFKTPVISTVWWVSRNKSWTSLIARISRSLFGGCWRMKVLKWFFVYKFIIAKKTPQLGFAKLIKRRNNTRFQSLIFISSQWVSKDFRDKGQKACYLLDCEGRLNFCKSQN